jgi:hypothetical protein
MEPAQGVARRHRLGGELRVHLAPKPRRTGADQPWPGAVRDESVSRFDLKGMRFKARWGDLSMRSTIRQ